MSCELWPLIRQITLIGARLGPLDRKVIDRHQLALG